METIEQINNKDQVIILVGKKQKGSSNLHKPIRSIVVVDAQVEQVHSKIKEMIENESS